MRMVTPKYGSKPTQTLVVFHVLCKNLGQGANNVCLITVPLPRLPCKAYSQTNLYLEPHDYRIYHVNIDLRHQYGISAAESQSTFRRAKLPQRRRARRNGCFRRLHWTKKRNYLYSVKFGANHRQMPHLLNCAQLCQLTYDQICHNFALMAKVVNAAFASNLPGV